jgi:hypothetical protein
MPYNKNLTRHDFHIILKKEIMGLQNKNEKRGDK